MHDSFGAMNKHTFIRAIEEPFIKAFTIENIMKSFKTVSLHPFDPSVITTPKLAPSIPTTINGPSLTGEPSPVKAMRSAFTVLLNNATLPDPSPSLHLHLDHSPPTSALSLLPSIAS